MTTKYKGWIPTAAGRLSFSLIGETENHSPSVFVNRADASRRYIICAQERILADTVLPFKKWLPVFFLHLCGYFYFVCIAKSPNSMSENDASLEGEICLYMNEKSWRSAEVVTGYAGAMLKYFSKKTEDLSTNFNGIFESSAKELRDSSFFWVKFSLDRDGEVAIEFDDGLVHKRRSIFDNLDYGSIENIKDDISAQCFYFLRDITHYHQHHSPSSDTIMDLYRDSDDIYWREESLRVLYRKILDYKRKRKDEIYCSSLGLLTYVKSFKRISNNKLRPRGLSDHGIDDGLLEESIKASQNATYNTLQAKIKTSDTIRNTIIAYLGIFISYIGLVKLTEIPIKTPNDNYLVQMADWTINESWLALPVAVTVFYVTLIAIGVVKVGKNETIRNMHKFLQAFPKIAAVLFWIISGLLGLALFIYLTIYRT